MAGACVQWLLTHSEEQTHSLKTENKPSTVVCLCDPALRRLRQEDDEFEASVSYTKNPCLLNLYTTKFTHVLRLS